jgi:hypothetical protein
MTSMNESDLPVSRESERKRDKKAGQTDSVSEIDQRAAKNLLGDSRSGGECGDRGKCGDRIPISHAR